MSNRPVYLVITTRNIGGVEKRLIGIWLHIRKTDNRPFTLIISRELYEQALETAELAGLRMFEEDILFHLVSDSYLQTQKNLRQFALERPTSCVFHHVLAPPLFRVNRHLILFTYPSTSFGKYNARGLLSLFNGFRLAQVIDVLDPRVFAFLRKLFFYKKTCIHNTPGSYVNLDLFTPGEFSRRENRVVFLGLLSCEKQADRLLEMLPELHSRLVSAGYADICFSVLGRESADFNASEICASWDPRLCAGMEYEIREVRRPADLLARSKVFLSLQRTDNYPSRSLLEAMACGVVPVVTRVGNSLRIAGEGVAEYVPGNFTVDELFAAVKTVLNLTPAEYQSRTALAASQLQEDFSIQGSVDYFLKLYQQ